jgi:hypothetical protein
LPLHPPTLRLDRFRELGDDRRVAASDDLDLGRLVDGERESEFLADELRRGAPEQPFGRRVGESDQSLFADDDDAVREAIDDLPHDVLR